MVGGSIRKTIRIYSFQIDLKCTLCTLGSSYKSKKIWGQYFGAHTDLMVQKEVWVQYWITHQELLYGKKSFCSRGNL